MYNFPPSSNGKTGWPWIQTRQVLPKTMPDGEPWPRISIVTPSLNQGQFIEETIRSVLIQGYPNLEYIIIDGGSTDATIKIIQKYEPWLTYWVSEKDRGQTHAINKGLARATGNIAAYLNSDDTYMPRAFVHVAKCFAQNKCHIFVGCRYSPLPPKFLLRRGWLRPLLKPFVYPYIAGNTSRYDIPQECVFWDHERFKHLEFDERYQFCMDARWFATIYSAASVTHSSQRIGFLRTHPESKTSRLHELYRAEVSMIDAELAPYVRNISQHDKSKVDRIYRYSSLKALILTPFLVFSPFYLTYWHPPYLQGSPLDNGLLD